MSLCAEEYPHGCILKETLPNRTSALLDRLAFTLMSSVSASHLFEDALPICNHILKYKRLVFQTELCGSLKLADGDLSPNSGALWFSGHFAVLGFCVSVHYGMFVVPML